MRTKRQRAVEVRDIVTLTLARAILDESPSLGDAQLVESLRTNGIPSDQARASLVRLEASGHVRFGPSGWVASAPSGHAPAPAFPW